MTRKTWSSAQPSQKRPSETTRIRPEKIPRCTFQSARDDWSWCCARNCVFVRSFCPFCRDILWDKYMVVNTSLEHRWAASFFWIVAVVNDATNTILGFCVRVFSAGLPLKYPIDVSPEHADLSVVQGILQRKQSQFMASKQHPWYWVRIANPRHGIPGMEELMRVPTRVHVMWIQTVIFDDICFFFMDCSGIRRDIVNNSGVRQWFQ